MQSNVATNGDESQEWQTKKEWISDENIMEWSYVLSSSRTIHPLLTHSVWPSLILIFIFIRTHFTPFILLAFVFRVFHFPSNGGKKSNFLFICTSSTSSHIIASLNLLWISIVFLFLDIKGGCTLNTISYTMYHSSTYISFLVRCCCCWGIANRF